MKFHIICWCFFVCLFSVVIAKKQGESNAAGTSHLFSEFIAGTIAGLITCFLFYPLECVEAKLQISNKNTDESIWEMLVTTVRTEGITGLYLGLTPTLIGFTLNWGLYFTVYQFMNQYWKDLFEMQSSTPLTYLLSAIVAGTVCVLLINPFWVLKIRVISARGRLSTWKVLKQILKSDGYAGLWKGVGPSLFGISEGATQFVAYEQLKVGLQGPDGLSVIAQLTAGAVARAIATLVTYPYILVRSVLQLQNSPYSSIVDACTKIVKQEGVSGLYRGMMPNLIRSVPPAAFMFYLVEYIRAMLA